MALYPQRNNIAAEAIQLRQQGLPDSIIHQELQSRGYAPGQIDQALQQAESAAMSLPTYAESAAPDTDRGNIYERIEEITESIIDEKWDDLIAEVKKIVEWKESMEQKQAKIQGDLDQLKENFTMLHQGVLGRLEDYDDRMREVGTELKAVGKVFKDVIPQFVENVKELSSVTEKMKKG